jgi:gliding motility-associated-like protein
VQFEVTADQGSQLDYEWIIYEGLEINMSDSLDESFLYSVNRPPSTGLDLDLRFQLRTTNFALCESPQTTQDIVINRQPTLQASFSPYPQHMQYPNTTVTVDNKSISENGAFEWDFGDGYITNERDPAPHIYELSGIYTIRLSIEEDHCSSSDTASITIVPRPPVADFSFDPQSGCAPLTVHFTNLTQNARVEMSTFTWNFGENQAKSNALNPTYTYYEPGIYSVKLDVTNQDGLSDAMLKTQIIEVYPSPMVNFDIRPTTVSVPDDPIFITNFSKGAVDYYWDFGDGGNSYEFEPSHIYTDTGSYDITLVGITDRGCADTMRLKNVVQVVNDQKVKIPNAFTPSLEGPSNGSIYADGRNDVFYPITEGVLQYKMQIFNRWGELIFETQDKNHGWDGYYNGRICPQDVYIYKIDFKYIDGGEESKFGDVTLIR